MTNEQNPHNENDDPKHLAEGDGTNGIEIPNPTGNPKPNAHNSGRKLRIRERFSNWRKQSEAKWKDTPIHDRTNVRLTRVIAVSTVLYTAFAGWTLWEIHSGSSDTHKLAVAAKTQADQSTTIAAAAKRQACSAKHIADAAGRSATASEGFATSADEINSQTQIAVTEFQRIAKAAENSVNSTLEISRLEQRPWISVEANIAPADINKPAPDPFNFVVTNTGRTFARKAVMTNHSTLSPVLLESLPVSGSEPIEKSVAVLPPNAPSIINIIPSGHIGTLREVYSAPLATNEWYLYIWGEISYEDVFHPPGRHSTEFCFYRKLSQIGQPDQCAAHNEAD
ncbi:MAG: hypothetical protein WA539_13640 [Candidatus Sulfotelmatobacter sp.]